MHATRQAREHHASAQRGQRGKSTPTAEHVAQCAWSRMSREAFSIVASVGSVGAAAATGRGLSNGVVDARTGGGGRTILMRRWGVWVGDVGMGMLAEGAGKRGAAAAV